MTQFDYFGIYINIIFADSSDPGQKTEFVHVAGYRYRPAGLRRQGYMQAYVTYIYRFSTRCCIACLPVPLLLAVRLGTKPEPAHGSTDCHGHCCQQSGTKLCDDDVHQSGNFQNEITGECEACGSFRNFLPVVHSRIRQHAMQIMIGIESVRVEQEYITTASVSVHLHNVTLLAALLQ